MRKSIYIALCLIAMAHLVGCSTKKNTWVTRRYHSTTTRFNIHFNGVESYQAGLKSIAEAGQDDFAHILHMYPISYHPAAEAGKSAMDRAIEKSRKSIKLHSIQKKPRRNTKKLRDPKYIQFYNQSEFNTWLDDAWLLLGKAEFHKGDFMEAIGTFSYVARHYANHTDVVAECQLWIARAYAEMGWLYEAEEVFDKIKQADLNRKNAALYAAFMADFYIKGKRYREAIPYLQIAVANEKSKQSKVRFQFVLGQLEQLVGSRSAAESAYNSVIKANPSIEMDFNARINKTQLSPNTEQSLKRLRKMAKEYKFKDNLDQIYGAIGHIYLGQADTVGALQNYRHAVDESTQKGLPLAAILVKMGDIYYQQRNYLQAQPCYEQASSIISVESEEYAFVSNRAQTLGEVVAECQIVHLQDSLQRLSKMSEQEQLRVIEKMLSDREQAEKEAVEKAEELARRRESGGLQGVNTQNMIGGGTGGQANWYFYNPNLMKSGRQEFARKWGNRKLEDNWRRISKSVTAHFADDSGGFDPQGEEGAESSGQARPEQVTDTKNPTFYLQQIPKTAQQLALSDQEIATALYKLGSIYADKVGDTELALETFEEFERRFGSDSRLIDIYYQRYMLYSKQNDAAMAERMRIALVQKFPESKQATILSNPNYSQQLGQMHKEQEALYEASYNAYMQSDYGTVFKNTAYAERHFPLAAIMPKFLFLEALSTGKTQSQEAFGEALRRLVARYPESDVSAMSKDMLALMNQGMESRVGASHGTLISRRNAEAVSAQEQPIDDYTFSSERVGETLLFIVIENDEDKLKRLLYQVALFNFSQFMVKDFDLTVVHSFREHQGALQVSSLESMEESIWYQNMLLNSADLKSILGELGATFMQITEHNYRLIERGLTWEEYSRFAANQGW